mmetsp:Transcript_25253/g.33613  ORF Transcript_25253/g.33613 Transcript_25253/m.33613 type:complete len:247 (-) Transcript_25253:341-1081(-)
MVIIGLVGPTASGKSTLLTGLHSRFSSSSLDVVSCDNHFFPPDKCPTFDLANLPWPNGGTIPEAFARRGNVDFNHPDSIDWHAVRGDILSKIDSLRNCEEETDFKNIDLGLDAFVVVVDSHLLLAEHPGARNVLDLCHHVIVVTLPEKDNHETVDSDKNGYPSVLSQNVLMQRKYRRSGHLGKLSYAERGVTEEEYRTYWNHYVWPSWLENGGKSIPSDALLIDCTMTTDEQIKLVLGNGWLDRLA